MHGRDAAREAQAGLPARRAAVEVLAAVLQKKQALDDVLGRSLETGAMFNLPPRDRALARAISLVPTPSAAASTIRARSTIRCSLVPARCQERSVSCSASDNTMGVAGFLIHRVYTMPPYYATKY